MPDLAGFVTWDRLEDAFKGIPESIGKSTNNANASTRDNQSTVHRGERQSPAVSFDIFLYRNLINYILFSYSQTNERYVRIRLLTIMMLYFVQDTSGEGTGSPSSNLAELLAQLGTLNNRHEQLRALVEALEVKENEEFCFLHEMNFFFRIKN
jgi:hypothetical protein